MAHEINIGLDGLKNKAEMMGDALDKQQDNIKGLEVEIDKTHKELLTDNARLKKIIYQVL